MKTMGKVGERKEEEEEAKLNTVERNEKYGKRCESKGAKNG